MAYEMDITYNQIDERFIKGQDVHLAEYKKYRRSFVISFGLYIA